ncbi:MAG TPA: BCCT family transporter, partial [Streptomyces sp.]|nr:BCCT family transporter [Streptomyces sp.]
SALNGLKNLTILVAVPFTLVMVGMCVAMTRDLRRDRVIIVGERGDEAVETAVKAGHEKYGGDFEFQIGPSEGDSLPADAGPGHGETGPDAPADGDAEGTALRKD